ncbi:MAG: antitoxin [Myxococcales bacterium]|nr:antitoxin [Myxococcales bacterium]
MKTTVDLPGDLVREVKLKALLEGRKLKDAVTDLLRRGLAAGSGSPLEGAARNRRARLPLVQCRHAARSGSEVTPERVAEILLDQEASWNDDAGR